jgi:hypothetical protein
VDGGHIFLSYTSADKALADEVVRELESGGLRIWYAPRDVRPGIDYSEQIQKAIETAMAFVVVISEASNQSDFVRAETEMAFSRRRPIFPVRASPIAPASGLALFLQLRHWTDLFGPARQDHLHRLHDELAASTRARRGGPRRGGPTLFRPRLARLGRGSTGGSGAARSYLPLILVFLGCGALILALALAAPSGSQANMQGGGYSPDEAAGAAGGTNVSAQDYDPLRDDWVRYARDTAPPPPPPPEYFIDNALDVAADAAADAAANITIPDTTDDVNGM